MATFANASVGIGGGGGSGAPGVDGKTVRYGTGAPGNGLGVDGDFYIATNTSFIYGPKASGSWPAGTSLIGPAGTNGTNGADGKTVRYGTGAPSNGLGTDGDFYIATDTNFIYGPKASGAWPSGTSLVGPAPTLKIDTVSSGVNRYITSAHRSVSTSTQSVTLNRIYYIPLRLNSQATVTSLMVNITSAVAGNCRIGIYDYNTTTGYIGSQLVSSTDLDTSSTGSKTFTLGTPLTLSPGWYFTAFVTSATTLQILGSTSNLAQVIGTNPFGWNNATTPVAIELRYESAASAVLPATPSNTTTAQLVGVAHPPLIFLGVQ